MARRGAPPSCHSLGSVIPGQPWDTQWLNRAKGNPVRSSWRLWVFPELNGVQLQVPS